MRIKKLELQGFKSFKDRTVIQFDEGITGIVGPNGCGKSNIVDALVWVMGEMSAKHLRGSSMEDVIFAGAEGYAPVGMAEVSLTLANEGGPFPAKYMKYSEIMLTRRLHRSGESEYLINKEPARLRDVQEVFMDTGAGSKGFSIIEQGAIGKIITAKPEDRRTLIEEAAGITKFKVRKRESQRKLTATDQNLVRLQDIIGEQKRQLDSLQRQAQRAERYKKIKDEARDKELWLTSHQYLKINDETIEAQKTFDEAKEQEAAVSGDINQLEADVETLKLEAVEKEKLVNEKQEFFFSKKESTSLTENEIRELQFEIETAKRNKEMTGSIVEQYQARKEALVKDQNEYQEKLNVSSSDADRMEEEFESKANELERVQNRIRDIDDELTNKRREMLTVSQSESHLEARESSLTTRISEVEENLKSASEILNELDIKKAEFEQSRNKTFNALEQERQLQLSIMGDVENFQENLNLVKNEAEEKQKEVQEFKDQLNEVSSRLYGLKDLHANFEGFQEGVKNVMLWQRQRMEATADGGMQPVAEFQPVAEILEVPEEYEMAMEAALGQKLQMLLSHDQSETMSAVNYLKENNSGRSSFFSGRSHESDSVAESYQQLLNQDGVVGSLLDKVRVPDSHQQSVAYFLKDIIIVDSIMTGLQLRESHPEATFVTMDGDTLTREGVLTGGSSEGADSGVLKRRREIKELSQKREEWAGKLSLAQVSLKKLEARVKTLEEELEKAKKLHSEKEILITELKKDLERSENELSNATEALERQKVEVSRVNDQLEHLRNDDRELKEKLAEIRESKLNLESAVAQLNEELVTSKTGIDDLQETVTRLKVDSASKRQQAEGIRHQLEMVENSLSETQSQLDKMSEETDKTTESLSSNQILIEEKRVLMERLVRETQEAEKVLSEIRNAYEEMTVGLREKEQSLSEQLRGVNDFRTTMNEAQLKLEQLQMKEQYYIDQINERYMLDLREEADKYKDVVGDMEATEKEVDELKKKMKRIGEVNLSAIEEYEDLIGRYEFLKQQHEDLLEAKEQLRKVIDRINRICTKRFKETFEKVNERFIKVFPVLFGGGEARLILIEDPEKGEMGIDIVAKPPGKKLQNVGLLSGGEKALTAVSLIFSIFLVKPSPYCLLDEVDAPLDDANVFRYNDLVREMAKRSQLICVTHNKHTMKVADKLYGVTMEEKGVSKMVSVNLNKAVQVAEA